jgi:hypothetical protein
MKRATAVQWTIRVMATALALAASVPVFAQGCAMCYNDAAAAKSTAIQALRSGTLILLFPVLLLFTGILLMAVRSRNRFHEVGAAEPPASGPGADSRGRDDWAYSDGLAELELVVVGEDERERGQSGRTAS